ncbi:cytochrome c biogenesis CcdA family protein [Microvirga flavescens]|uniref:cytochrome c biogenesis CcdA family protein n=1 Tax=Microvirga flavescens TaxID=2249811 RepID=UPI000DDB0B6E|nr:cytochrome c biogenesis protein CcdA [Microvirga flavescens]
MLNVSLPAAMLGGFISFLSPCVLPLVPPYLSFLAGTTFDELHDGDDKAVRRRAIGAALLFVAGFATVFVLLGATASALGQVVRQYLDVLSAIAGFAIIVMGLHFVGVFRVHFLYREARLHIDKPIGLWGAYVMGLAFAFGWTPCIGPVLAAILAVAGSEASVAHGAVLLAAYSAGLGIPFLLAAFAMKPFTRFLKRMHSRFIVIERTMGVLLIITGLSFIPSFYFFDNHLAGWITQMSFWLLETFPVLGRLG